MDTSNLKLVELHSMDHAGTLAGTIENDGHEMTIKPWWSDDGTTGEHVECSCGFESHRFSGHGAWQVGHDGPPEEHTWDDCHRTMYDAAWDWWKSAPRN